MKQFLFICNLFIGMMGFAQPKSNDLLISTMIYSIDQGIPGTNELLFQDYICSPDPFSKSTRYEDYSRPDAPVITTFVRYWDEETVELLLPISEVDEPCLQEYLASRGEQDYSLLSENGYEKAWSDPWFTYTVIRCCDEIVIRCHRYYDLD